jgi:hypothetical protein
MSYPRFTRRGSVSSSGGVVMFNSLGWEPFHVIAQSDSERICTPCPNCYKKGSFLWISRLRAAQNSILACKMRRQGEEIYSIEYT